MQSVSTNPPELEETRIRARSLGIRIGPLEPGLWNAITDVPGVRVGQTTLISGDGPLILGQGPVRTGVTVIVPHEGGSGDLFLAFSTGNRGMGPKPDPAPIPVLAYSDGAISDLFAAAIDATQEAIVNALCMATTMVGVAGRTSHAIPLDRLQEVMRTYHRWRG